MIKRLEVDIEDFPQLFHLYGPSPIDAFSDWRSKLGIYVPEDLADFWQVTGGGEMFESETIFPPLHERDAQLDVVSQNAFHRGCGMTSRYLLFHSGLELSAFDTRDGSFAFLSPTYLPIRTFYSLDEWYENGVRANFATKYQMDLNK